VSDISAVPLTISPTTVVPNLSTKAVRTATSNLIEFNDQSIINNAQVIVDLLFENIGGQELLSLGRHDTVNGQDVRYQPIKNLGLLSEEYNPKNLVKIQQTSDKIFSNFPIKLNERIPVVGGSLYGDNVYLNEQGALVIEFINLLPDERIEVEIVSSGTIYEVGI
jgi:hypothetical protein